MIFWETRTRLPTEEHSTVASHVVGMSSNGSASGMDRRRIGWWLVGAALALVVGLVVRSFVGTLVFGLFVYYAIRPIHRRLLAYADSRVTATSATMIVAAVPLLAILLYGAGLALREFLALAGSETAQTVIAQFGGDADSLTRIVQNPTAVLAELDRVTRLREGLSAVLGTVGFIGGVFLRLSLALALSFFLLQDGHRIEDWFRSEIAKRGSTADVFLRGVDADLETVYFGNVLTVLGVTVASIVVYHTYNFLAPAAVSLPAPTLLALLTGVATFVPLVVGKLVYVPAGALLVWNAVQFDAPLGYPLGFLVVAFLFLDILPQTFLRPYVSGRSLHSGLVLFGYVLGAAYFGWYGLFLGPLIVVLGVQFTKHVLPDLADGSEFVPERDEGVEIGTDPLEEEVKEEAERETKVGDGDSDDNGLAATGESDDDTGSDVDPTPSG
jgi:predicted PurR-regulated permease PerM